MPCRHVKDADKEIIAAMRAAGRLIDHSNYSHSYPFCWRSDTPLIYKVPRAPTSICDLPGVGDMSTTRM